MIQDQQEIMDCICEEAKLLNVMEDPMEWYGGETRSQMLVVELEGQIGDFWGVMLQSGIIPQY